MDCKDLIETYEKKRKEKTDKKKEADKRKSGTGGILFLFLIDTYASRKLIVYSVNDYLLIFVFVKKVMQYQIL